MPENQLDMYEDEKRKNASSKRGIWGGELSLLDLVEQIVELPV